MQRFWKYKIDHIIFWVITVGFHVYTNAQMVEWAGWPHFLIEILLRNTLLAIIIYANFEYLIPALALRRKFVAYGAGLLLCFAFYVVVKNAHDAYLTGFLGKTPLPFWRYSFYNFSIALFYTSFSLALQLSKEWYFQRQRLHDMEVEKLNTELEYLKSQINPHFLFNSLNTIFFQIDRSNVNARETLTKFSDMLRFQLYECNGHEMPLEKELSYLRNFVDLQRLRKDDKYIIRFNTSGDCNSFLAAPLLIMPLVENAFKYVSHFPEGDNLVDIDVQALDTHMVARVMNTRETRASSGEADRSVAGGIGLRNLRRRLELQYPGRHSLEVRETNREFEVVLTLMNK